MNSAVKVQRVRVQWPDTKGRLRWIWAYRIGDELPQLTPKLARVEHERTRRIRASMDAAPRTHEQLMQTPVRSPANRRCGKSILAAAIMAAMAGTHFDP